jgi:hypothetical protein
VPDASPRDFTGTESQASGSQRGSADVDELDHRPGPTRAPVRARYSENASNEHGGFASPHVEFTSIASDGNLTPVTGTVASESVKYTIPAIAATNRRMAPSLASCVATGADPKQGQHEAFLGTTGRRALAIPSVGKGF